MLILLPPSESKYAPARGKSLDLGALAHPALNPLRRDLLKKLQSLCREDPAGAIEALELGPTQFDLVVQNGQLDSLPTASGTQIPGRTQVNPSAHFTSAHERDIASTCWPAPLT